MDPNANNPYEFIMNPSKKVRRNPFSGGGFVTKVTIIVGLAAFVMIALWVITTAMSSGGGNLDQVASIAQTQQEIRRITTQGAVLARGQKVRNFGATTTLTLSSNQIQTLNFLKDRGMDVSDKDLQLKKNPVTDQKLTQARNASEFDAAFVSEVQTEIQAYQVSLKTTYNGTKSVKEKELLAGLYTQANLLLQQSKETF